MTVAGSEKDVYLGKKFVENLVYIEVHHVY